MAGSQVSKSSSQYRCVWGIWKISSCTRSVVSRTVRNERGKGRDERSAVSQLGEGRLTRYGSGTLSWTMRNVRMEVESVRTWRVSRVDHRVGDWR